jgi:hypothetical protein
MPGRALGNTPTRLRLRAPSVCSTDCSAKAGGNVSFAKVPIADVSGLDLVNPQTKALALGLAEHPQGPPKDRWVSAEHLYRAITTGAPYKVRGLLGFEANLLVGHANAAAGVDALRQLEF